MDYQSLVYNALSSFHNWCIRTILGVTNTNNGKIELLLKNWHVSLVGRAT